MNAGGEGGWKPGHLEIWKPTTPEVHHSIALQLANTALVFCGEEGSGPQ